MIGPSGRLLLTLCSITKANSRTRCIDELDANFADYYKVIAFSMTYYNINCLKKFICFLVCSKMHDVKTP